MMSSSPVCLVSLVALVYVVSSLPVPIPQQEVCIAVFAHDP